MSSAALEILEPALDEIVVSQNSSPRALDVDELAAIAVDVFGEDRVTVEPRLDDAIESAVRLAEESNDGQYAGSGRAGHRARSSPPARPAPCCTGAPV